MLDIPKIFTAFAEWCTCIIFIAFTVKRITGIKLAAVAALWFAVFAVWQFGTSYFPLLLWPLGIAVAAAFMVLFIFCCGKIRFIEAVYLGASAFIVAEFIASVEWQCFYYLKVTFNLGFAQSEWFKYFFAVVIYSICFTAFAFCEKKFFARIVKDEITVKTLLPTIFIVLVCFISSNVAFLTYGNDPEIKITEKIFEVRTLFDFCGLVLVYVYRILRENFNNQTEIAAMQNILDKQYRQYRAYKKNDEIISRHYHDLKHQVDVILNEKELQKREEYLKDMCRSIKIRQTESLTGNEVLDTVLSGKRMGCVKDGITFNVVADGKLLKFMSTMDICSVFGNSIDNAVESVKKVEDCEKRIIQIALFEQHGMIVYRIRNYYETAPVLINNEIVTLKKDKSSHGYGLKSIKGIVSKYGGTTAITYKDNWFTLCVTFPREVA